MIVGKTEAETVRLTAYVLGVSEAQARFIIAVERGEIDGDVVDVNDDRRDGIKRPPTPEPQQEPTE